MEQISETDSLTGIANRRRFDRRLDEEWARLARHGGTLALLLVDIDYFKPFNDLYGHQEGDRCLRQVATILAACARRPGDLVARYGGEEFAIVLPHTDEAAAQLLARRMTDAVDLARIPHRGSAAAAHVTLSIGVALAREADAGEAAGLIERADRALYRAKAAGRHRVEIG